MSLQKVLHHWPTPTPATLTTTAAAAADGDDEKLPMKDLKIYYPLPPPLPLLPDQHCSCLAVGTQRWATN